jgi:putative oxidoreductase
MWRKILSTDAAASVILIRLMVGLVFLSEGIQKFLFPEKVSVGASKCTTCWRFKMLR